MRGSRDKLVRSLAPGASGDGTTAYNLEIELKLGGRPETLDTAWQAHLGGRGRVTEKHLVSTYFDTSDLRLQRKGFTLRIRQNGKGLVQTLKADAGGAAGLMARGEWSVPVPSLTPDLSKIDDADVLERLGLILPSELAPVFTTDVTRRIKTVTTSGRGKPRAKIEVALDRGEIRTDDAREPISEIEFELLEGAPQALYAYAAALHAKTPLQIETVSKATRGYALAAAQRHGGSRANGLDLAPDVTLDVAMGRVFRACGQHWLANHAAVLDGSDPEGVHQMRVALRRLRSALSLFKGVLSPDDATWLQTEAKALIGDLGAARDWDVFSDELLQPVIDARPDDSDLGALRDAVEDARRSGYDRARAALQSPRYTAFVLEFNAWLEGSGWRNHQSAAELERPLIDLADRLLQKRHKNAMKLGRRFKHLSDEALHELRIALKKLRYAAEFFVSLYAKKRSKPYIRALRQLQDDLGHLNDVAVAEVRLRGLTDAGSSNSLGTLTTGAGLVLGWYAQALEAVRPRIADDWHRFVDTKPFWQQHRQGA